MARPTKLTLKLQAAIVQAIRAGNYAEQAARAFGIASSTYYRWLSRGELEQEGIYHDFAEAVRRAEAEAEVEAVMLLRAAMPEDWRAALAYLERRFPGRWRRHTSTELVGPDGGPIQTKHTETIDYSQLSDEDLARLEEMYEGSAATRD